MHNILVTGSLAYDHIMTFPDRFKNHILPEKIHILSVSFLIDSLKQEFGGTAGNIAYNLGLLEMPCTLFATIGKNHEPYRKWAQKHGLDFGQVKKIPAEETACAYIMTDLDDNQIAAFHPGAMNEAHQMSINDLERRPRLAIIAPNGKKGMIKFGQECRKLKIPYIFDPGQQIPAFSKYELIELLFAAKALAVNDYELELVQKETALKIEDILKHVEFIVVTKGGKGSAFITKQGQINIPAVPAKRIVDPTGCGDAFRAGLIYGLMKGYDLQKTGQIASLVGSFNVEVAGTQNHSFTLKQFEKRYKEVFGKVLQ